MSTFLFAVVGLAVIGGLYYLYSKVIGNKTIKDTYEEMTLKEAAAAVQKEVSKELDVNKDGKVDVKDAKAAVKKTAPKAKEAATKVAAKAKKTADVNKDGKVDTKDVKAAVKRATAKKPAKK